MQRNSHLLGTPNILLRRFFCPLKVTKIELMSEVRTDGFCSLHSVSFKYWRARVTYKKDKMSFPLWTYLQNVVWISRYLGKSESVEKSQECLNSLSQGVRDWILKYTKEPYYFQFGHLRTCSCHCHCQIMRTPENSGKRAWYLSCYLISCNRQIFHFRNRVWVEVLWSLHILIGDSMITDSGKRSPAGASETLICTRATRGACGTTDSELESLGWSLRLLPSGQAPGDFRCYKSGFR